MFLLFVLLALDKKERFESEMTIKDTVKFVYGHTETSVGISCGNIELTRGFKSLSP